MKYFKLKEIIGLISFITLMMYAVAPVPAQTDALMINKSASIVNDNREILFGAPDKWRAIYEEFEWYNTALWDSTSNSGGITISAADSASAFYSGSPIILVTKAATNALGQIRWKGHGFWFYGARRTFVEFRLAFTDTSNSGFKCGVTTRTDSLAGVGRVPTAGAYFMKKPSSATLYAVVVTAAGVADTVSTGVRFTRMTSRTLKIVWTGTRLQFYVDGVMKYSQTAGETPATSVFPVFAIRANSAATQKLYIDYVWAKQQRI